jgi:hypothetical protein
MKIGTAVLFASILAATAGEAQVPGNPACVQDFPTAAAADPNATVVMCGLDNPRGLAFSEFALFVAEAGRGGLGVTAAPCFTGNAAPMVNNRCYAPTGAISRLWNGSQERVATGFPSHANLQGRMAIGPNDIALSPALGAGGGGSAFVAIGLQQPPAFRTQYPFLADFAKLARLDLGGEWSYAADLGAYEAEHDPDSVFFGFPKLDTNPYGLIADGRNVVVTDAGGNSMLRVVPGGDGSPVEHIVTVAVFPPNIYPTYADDAVPTSIAVGPDGAYYVGELTGFPLVLSAANILRVGRSGQESEVCLTGFTQVIDLTFDRKTGDLYVLEFQGSLVRVRPAPRGNPALANSGDTCARYGAGQRSTVVIGLTMPTSVEVGPDGGVYVSNRGTFPGTGQVIRFAVQFD